MDYRKLNLSVQGRSQHWKNYREELASLYKKNIKGKVLLVGAGNGNDLDYDSIFELADSVTIADVDPVSVREGLKGKVAEIIETDLSLMNYDRAIKRLRTAIRLGDGEGYIGRIVPGELELGSYDTIIVSPIYTQIFLHGFISIINEMSQDEREKRILIELTIEKAADIYEKINHILSNSLNEGGSLALMTDLVQVSDEAGELDLETYVKDYFSKYGLSPSAYAHQHMADLLAVVSDTFHHWNFDEEKSYIVRMTIMQKIKAD